MNYGAVAHMPDDRYCYCTQPGRFLIRIQTGRGDLVQVKLHYQDKYIPVRFMDTRACVEMKLAAQDFCHDYYEVEISIDVVCLRYYFELVDRRGGCVYYSNCRFLKEQPQDIDRMFDLPQTLRETECFSIPQWASNKIVYQIFPARFASSKSVSDADWYQAPIQASTDLRGDLRGIIQHLDYIKNLGADIVYLTPIFHSRSSHKYDTIDYYTIDPNFGTTDDLIELVDKAHAMGMRVILDAVFNHTAPEFFAFADLENNWENSQYQNWYYCNERPVRPKQFGIKPNYKCFSYFGGMPKLNLDNPDTAEYVINVALYWLRTAHIDGWRLDVGDEVSHIFWRKFRAAIKKEFPDALIVGEVWHYAADFLHGDTWDTVMNYPFLNAAMDFVTDGTITASEFLNELGFLRGNLNRACYPLLWNLIGSHDTPRALHRCGENKEKLKLLAAMQLLLPGMPFIYYGDEVGLTGGRDPDCRRGMLWDPAKQDQQLYEYYRRLIDLRKSCLNLSDGAVLEQTADDSLGLVTIATDKAVIVFHSGDNAAPLPKYQGMRDLITGEFCDGIIQGYRAAVYITE